MVNNRNRNKIFTQTIILTWKNIPKNCNQNRYSTKIIHRKYRIYTLFRYHSNNCSISLATILYVFYLIARAPL